MTEEEIIEIPVKCKLCMNDIIFKFNTKEYENFKIFPIKREDVHGDPPHKIVVFFDKFLTVEKFEVEEVVEKEISISEELTKRVLKELELTDEEIDLYFLSTGRDVVSLGEMSLLIDKPKEECQAIAQKFVKKGLFREIVGATPHYSPLPPYAALIGQLKRFHIYISDIKSKVPVELNSSFSHLETQAKGVQQLKDYMDFMEQLKDEMQEHMSSQKKGFDKTITEILQIKGISKVIANLYQDTKKILETQIEEIALQFEEIKEKISKNLEKLRLGVIQQTVEKVIANVFEDGINKITESFNQKLIAKLKNQISAIETRIEEITSSSANSAEEIKDVFGSISGDFNHAVIKSEERIAGISDTILKSFNDLKGIFSTEVIDTLQAVLLEILDRLELSEKTTQEFWDRAKRASILTMRDIWFIRSVEAAKANMNELLPKAKMRILIVTPYISDINIDLIESCPKHVNIRVVANIDFSSSEQLEILEKLENMHNVDFRYRDRTNLWGINRDYEEVILCVLSKTEIKGKEYIEIAGIGSLIEEHIKIFVPILEDAWVNAKKDFERIKVKPSIQPEVKRSIKEEVVDEKVAPKPYIPPKQEVAPKPLPSKIPKSASINEENIIEPIKAAPVFVDEKSKKEHEQNLKKRFKDLIDELENLTQKEIGSILIGLKNEINTIQGYSSVLDQMDLAASPLTKNVPLNKSEANQLKKKLEFWRKKLRI